MQRPRFKAKFRGRDVFGIRTPRSGITYSPFLEWILAAVWANYQPTEFIELDGELQSLIVAAYETNSQIEAVLIDDQNKKMQRDARRRK